MFPGDTQLRAWTSEWITDSTREFFDSLCEGIRSAKHTVWLEYYIFADPKSDVLASQISQALFDAANRGVDVRLLVDGVGSAGLSKSDFPAHPKFSFRVYSPLPGLSRLNNRNHRKVALIDGKTAWVGSQNVWKEQLHWLDVGVRLEGPGIAELERLFRSAWDSSHVDRLLKKIDSLHKRKPEGHVSYDASTLIRGNDTASRRRFYYDDLLRRIRSARNRVWIMSPYFVPRGSLLRALKLSAWSGADVRILAPETPDVKLFRWLSPYFYSKLLRFGVTVWLFGPRSRNLHAKIVIIDDWMTVGTTNLNHRSLLHDLEVDAVLTKPESRKQLETLYRRYEDATFRVTPEVLARIPIWERALGWLLLRVKHFL